MKGTHTEMNLTHVNSRGCGGRRPVLSKRNFREEQSQEKQDALSKT